MGSQSGGMGGSQRSGSDSDMDDLEGGDSGRGGSTGTGNTDRSGNDRSSGGM
jgi:hypothetical protein